MSFQKGHKINQEWTLENAGPRFQDALQYAEKNENCLCLQDAIYYSAIPYTTFYYLADNHDMLNSLKSDIMNAIIRRINRLALTNRAAAAAAIWRMKQLGEIDMQNINQFNSSNINIEVNDEKTKNEIDKLMYNFENEDSQV